jgi:hypothetical protein
MAKGIQLVCVFGVPAMLNWLSAAEISCVAARLCAMSFLIFYFDCAQ